jgi:hypothetical protein
MPDEDDAGERLVQAFREIAQIDSKHDIVEDGLYKGCMVRYTNGTELYHPYIPLMVSGAAPPGSVTLQTRYGAVRLVDGYPVYADMMPSPSPSKH